MQSSSRLRDRVSSPSHSASPARTRPASATRSPSLARPSTSTPKNASSRPGSSTKPSNRTSSPKPTPSKVPRTPTGHPRNAFSVVSESPITLSPTPGSPSPASTSFRPPSRSTTPLSIPPSNKSDSEEEESFIDNVMGFFSGGNSSSKPDRVSSPAPLTRSASRSSVRSRSSSTGFRDNQSRVVSRGRDVSSPAHGVGDGRREGGSGNRPPSPSSVSVGMTSSASFKERYRRGPSRESRSSLASFDHAPTYAEDWDLVSEVKSAAPAPAPKGMRHSASRAQRGSSARTRGPAMKAVVEDPVAEEEEGSTGSINRNSAWMTMKEKAEMRNAQMRASKSRKNGLNSTGGSNGSSKAGARSRAQAKKKHKEPPPPVFKRRPDIPVHQTKMSASGGPAAALKSEDLPKPWKLPSKNPYPAPRVGGPLALQSDHDPLPDPEVAAKRRAILAKKAGWKGPDAPVKTRHDKHCVEAHLPPTELRIPPVERGPSQFNPKLFAHIDFEAYQERSKELKASMAPPERDWNPNVRTNDEPYSYLAQKPKPNPLKGVEAVKTLFEAAKQSFTPETTNQGQPSKYATSPKKDEKSEALKKWASTVTAVGATTLFKRTNMNKESWARTTGAKAMKPLTRSASQGSIGLPVRAKLGPPAPLSATAPLPSTKSALSSKAKKKSSKTPKSAKSAKSSKSLGVTWIEDLENSDSDSDSGNDLINSWSSRSDSPPGRSRLQSSSKNSALLAASGSSPAHVTRSTTRNVSSAPATGRRGKNRDTISGSKSVAAFNAARPVSRSSTISGSNTAQARAKTADRISRFHETLPKGTIENSNQAAYKVGAIWCDSRGVVVPAPMVRTAGDV